MRDVSPPWKCLIVILVDATKVWPQSLNFYITLKKQKRNRLRCSDLTGSLQKNWFLCTSSKKIFFFYTTNIKTGTPSSKHEIMNSISEIIYTRQWWLFKSNQTHTSKKNRFFKHNTNYVLHMKKEQIYIYIHR